MEPDANSDPRPSFAVRELDYSLPDELIAQVPPPRREDARLLIVDRTDASLRDSTITRLPDFLGPADLLVVNDTRVLPAKFTAYRTTGGTVKGLFVAEPRPGVWNVLLEGSRRLRLGESLHVPPPSSETKDTAVSPPPRAGEDAGGTPPPLARGDTGKSPPILDMPPDAIEDHGGAAGQRTRGAKTALPHLVTLQLIQSLGSGRWLARINRSDPVERILAEVGTTPLPPYIRRHKIADARANLDRSRYQTVFAQRPGAVAAPTAGLHLTQDLLSRIALGGVEIAYVTLHVGLGTFKPVAVEDLTRHVMHEEWFDLTATAADAVNRCRARGGRIVAVGTTTLRVLESAAHRAPGAAILSNRKSSIDHRQSPSSPRDLVPCTGTTDLLIYPPFDFRIVDALLTNFHLPRSTLLALVMAFAGCDLTRRAYAHAILERYRFYSYGDAMFVASTGIRRDSSD
ncbi:MAG: S-adenosylmethionine:tRNA ribosyltransferase-isomerase [Planctomycetota bacterium]